MFIKKSAVFFELDGVIRRIKESKALTYIDEYRELPPAPLKPGEQELIEPVAAYIKDYCAQSGAVAIGVDQAPYLAAGFNEDDYGAIIRELFGMLREYGVPVVDFVFCDHAGKEIEEMVPDPTMGVRLVKKIVPDCICKFPNAGLFKGAAERHGITVFNDKGQYRFFSPSLLIHRSQEARDAAIEQVGLNCRHVESILNGSHRYKDMVEHVHLKTAALIKEHQSKVRDGHGYVATLGDNGAVINVDARSLPDLPQLPEHLNKPAGGSDA